MFKKITEAHRVLGDESKRKLYDQAGKQGVERGHAHAGGGGADLFSQMFGGGGGGGRGMGGPRKGPDMYVSTALCFASLFFSISASRFEVIC